MLNSIYGLQSFSLILTLKVVNIVVFIAYSFKLENSEQIAHRISKGFDFLRNLGQVTKFDRDVSCPGF